MQKRILSLFLCAAMVLSMLPVQVFAEEIPEEAFVQTPEALETEAPAATAETGMEATEVPEPTETVEFTVPDVTEETVDPVQEEPALATGGTCGDGLSWSLDGGVLTVSGSGPMYDFDGGYSPWWESAESITLVKMEYGVTTVGYGAFAECVNLESVTIPCSVTAIGDCAFYDCYSLTAVKIPGQVRAIGNSVFFGCESLESVTIPMGVTSIGAEAFCGAAMTTVKLPEGLVSIGDDAFYYCPNMTSITIPASLRSVGDYAFGECESLSTVYYTGTADQWSSISFGADNGLVTGAVRVYISGNPVYTFNKHTYQIFDQSMTWTEAQAYCEELGGHLVTVTSAEEQAFIESILENGTRKQYWMGLRIVEDAFAWVTGEPLSYTNWDAYEPDRRYNSGVYESYVHILNEANPAHAGASQRFKWNDMFVDNVYPGELNFFNPCNAGFICEFEEGMTFEDYVDNHAIEINKAGSAFAYYVGNPDKTYTYSGPERSGTATANEDGVFVIPLGSFTSPGTYDVEVKITKEGSKELKPEATVDATVTVTKLSFTQEWEASLDAGVGAGLTAGGNFGIGVLDAEATLGKVGAKVNGGTAMTISREFANGTENLEITSDKKFGGGVEVKSGVTAEVLEADFKFIEAAAGVEKGVTGTYGIRLDNYSPSNSNQQKAIATYLLGEALLVNPNFLIIKPFYEHMAKSVYSSAGCKTISGSALGIKAEAGADLAAVKVNKEELFTTAGIAGELSVEMSNKNLSSGATEKETSYKAEADLSVLMMDFLDVDLGGTLSRDFLGEDISITAKKEAGKKTIETSALCASTSALNTFILGKNYTAYYDKYSFRDESLGGLLTSSPAFDRYLNGNSIVLSTLNLAQMAYVLSKNETPIPYSCQTKEQALYSLGLEFDVGLGFAAEMEVALSYLENTDYDTMTGFAVEDEILITGESEDLKSPVSASKRDLTEIFTNVMVSLVNDVKNFFVEVIGSVKEGVEDAWAWIKGKGKDAKDWLISITSGKGSSAWGSSYTITTRTNSRTAALSGGITGSGSGDYSVSRAATIGRPFLVNVTDPATGEAVTDLSEEPLEFTIRYAMEDLDAAGLNVYSPAVQDDGIAMYRYSDGGDYFEYIGGIHDPEAMTVTATIVKPGQYILAADSCPPALVSLELSDFRTNPTITATVDDLTGLDLKNFLFELDGEEKVTGDNVAEYYNSKAGLFTYTVPEGQELADGVHTLSFTLADTTGNRETYEYTFHVDLTAPVIGEVTAEGSVNDGSELKLRAKIADEHLKEVWAVLSVLNSDGTWSEEVSTPMGDMGDGLWGLDYAGDGSAVKVFVRALDIGENSAVSKTLELRPDVESVSLSRAYIAMNVDDTVALTAEVLPIQLASAVIWSVEEGGENVISIDNGTVTALGEGTAYVTASVTDGNVTLTDRCRIDVAEPIKLEDIQLSTAKLTAELFSTDYAEFDVLLKLPQNYAATAAATAATPENKGVAITSAKFTDDTLAGLFDLVTLDDRTVAVVPNEKAVWNSDLVGKSYSSAVTVTVQGKEYTSEPLTLTVKKTLPKLKATVPAFNNFWSGQTQEITITGATVTGISCENLPDWLSLNGTELSLNENVPTKGGSAKLTLLVETEEWVVPVETTLAVKCSYKAPGLKLSASSIQLAGVNSDGVKLQLLSKDKKLTLNDLGVDGISAPEGYSISNYNAEDGTFIIKAESGFQPGKISLEVGFSNTSETVAIPLTVKVVPVTLKLAPSSITLNSGTGDSAAVTVTATPADYRLTAPNIRILDAAKQDKTDSGELKLSYENGRLSISTTETTPDNAKYTLYISAEGGKEAALKISTTNAEPTLKLKANGNLDLSFPERKIGLVTTFKNHSGGNLKAIDYTVTESSGKTVLDEDSKAIQLTKDGADLFVQLKDTTGINIKNTYTLNLKLTLENGKELESSVKIPVKQTNISLKLSANKVTLNKAIDDKATVTVTCATKDYNFVEPALTLLDSKGNDASGQLDVSWDNGKLTVATTEATPYGGSYKLQIADEKGGKAVTLAIAIPAEAKSTVTGTLKATGNLDVIRDGTALTVTPTWKNCNDAERTEILTIRNGSGEDVTANFSITEEDGKYILTRGADLDHSQKYTATLTATFANGETAVATGALKLKMGSAKLTLKADSMTMFANDKHSRVNVSFSSADSALNEVARVELDPKLANQFELFDYGNGQYAIGFKDGTVPAKLTSANIALNVWLEGNETAKANASVKVKVSIIR